MCDCIQPGEYICCSRGDKPQDKCIEIGNYMCCPRENPTCNPCRNHNSYCYGRSAKSCHCTRSRSEGPQQQQRYVEEKFSNMIPPSFLCKNTDPPKPKKVRKPKVSKKEKEKVDEATRDEPNYVPPGPMMPGIYMPEGMTLAPEIPQVNAEGGDVGAEAGGGGGEQPHGTIPNPNGLGYAPGYLPGQAISGYGPNVPPGYMPPSSSTIPGAATAPGQAYPGYVPNVPPGYLPPSSSTVPGAATAPGQAYPGYVPNVPPGHVPAYAPGSEGAPIYQPGTIPLPGQATVDPNLGFPGNPPAPYGPYGSPFGYTPQMPTGDPNSLGPIEEGSTSRQKEQAAGLPSHRQPPFNPCTGEECNRHRCLMRRSKSTAPPPRARNGLGVGFGPQQEYQPYHVEQSTKSARETKRDETPSFNCCCQCSLSSDLIERICKSLQISSCPCSCAKCPKMNATKKPTVSTIPAPRRKPKPSRSGTSQLGKKDDQNLDRDNSKLAAGPTKTASADRRTGSQTGSSASHSRGEEQLPATTSEESPVTAASSTLAAPGKEAGSKFSACGCGCKDVSTRVPIAPATRTCSCYANLMARSDDSTQTPPPETNEAEVSPPIGSQGGDVCCTMGGNGGTCCSGGACGGTGASCCKPGHSACCGNSCCWPYYYYYDPCTGLYYCYRNCCYNNCYKNTKCCNSCCNNSCCKPNNNNKKKSPTQEPKKTSINATKNNLSATNSPKRKETKTAAARKTNERNIGGDAMVSCRPEMQDLYEQWINFQEYLKQYQPQAAPMVNPMPGPTTAPTPASTPNPYGYYGAAISTPFYFAPPSYPNQMNNPAAGNEY